MKNFTSLSNFEPIPGSMRLFWKIVVEGNGDSLRAVKELGLWGDVDHGEAVPRRHRFMWKQIPLQVEIGPPERGGRHRDQERISVEDGYIFFNGGYLKIFDTSLVEDMRIWGYELDPANAEAAAVAQVIDVPAVPEATGYFDHFIAPGDSDYGERKYNDYPETVPDEGDGPGYYAGYNVRLEVEFAPERDNAARSQPIFYYPQDPANSGIGHVSLKVLKTADEHKLVWEVSGDTYPKSPGSAPRAYHLEEFHTVTVNQESSGPGSSEFEFLSNAIPLGIDSCPESHLFSKLGRYFYVGIFPDAKQEGAELFRGYLKRLMFDPNASCTSC
jgi:hypothetical protein